MSSPTPLTVSSAPANSNDAAKPTDNSGVAYVAWHRYVLYFGIAAVGCLLDLASKHWIFAWLGMPPVQGPRNVYWIIEGFFGIETALNPGALFGMGAGKSWLFATLSIVAAISIPVWLFVFKAARDVWLTTALGSVTAGIFGNLYDRLALYEIPGEPGKSLNYVRDWILFEFAGWPWPNFNIADCMLVGGAILLVLHAFFAGAQSKPKTEPAESSK